MEIYFEITRQLTLIAIITVFIYIGYMSGKKGDVLDSISETSYLVKSKKTFTIILSLVSIILLLRLFNIDQGYHLLSFLSMMGLFIVAFTPDYMEKNKVLHYSGGILCGIASQILIALINPWYLIVWVLIIPCLIYRKDCYTFWIEAICFLNISYFTSFG